MTSELTSRRSAMKRLWGFDDEQAEEELRRIRDEEPAVVEPTLGDDEGPEE